MVNGSGPEAGKIESGRRDVLVVGGGPAGLALASEVARLGLTVTVVATGLGETWEKSYGAFASDLSQVEPTTAVKRRFGRPLVTVSDREPLALEEEYLRFDTGSLQSLLFERSERAGVQFLSGTVLAVELNSVSETTSCMARLSPGPGDPHLESREVRLEARLVVNAAGGQLALEGGNRSTPTGYQSAYGEWIEVEAQGFKDGEMSLMDYRPVEESGPASFLYAIPETGTFGSHGTLFVQETVLVGEAPSNMAFLRTRLAKRLAGLGIRATRILGTERCVIPLGGALPARTGVTLPFGAAAGLVHPATGYQLATALRLAPTVARVIAERFSRCHAELVSSAIEEMWPEPHRNAYRFYELGAAILGTLSPRQMEAFISAFFELPGRRWQRFMAGTMSATEIAETMWSLFARAPLPLRLALLRRATSATTRHLSQNFN